MHYWIHILDLVFIDSVLDDLGFKTICLFEPNIFCWFVYLKQQQQQKQKQKNFGFKQTDGLEAKSNNNNNKTKKNKTKKKTTTETEQAIENIVPQE